MQTLPTRGAITYTAWPKAAEAPLLHHQLAKAQYDLEAAEMFTSRLSALYRGVLDRPPTIVERAQARAYIGHIASLSRAVRQSAIRGQQCVAHPAYRRHPAVLPRYQRVASACGHTAQQRRRGLRACAGGARSQLRDRLTSPLARRELSAQQSRCTTAALTISKAAGTDTPMSLCTMMTISGEFMPRLAALQTIAPVESNCWVLNEGYLSCNACR